MRRRAAVVAALTLTFATLPAFSSAVERSLRPVARGEIEADAPVRPRARPGPRVAAEAFIEELTADLPRVHPRSRPPSEQSAAASSRPESLAFLGPDTSPYPWARPKSVEQQALFGKRKKRKGSVCGNIDIQGEKVGKVPGKIRGCGIKDAVRVKSVSGVALSQSAVLSCEAAEALNTWVAKSVKPTFRRRGPVTELRVAAHYTCRTRNNQKGARISEHGRGKAIDISGFKMSDGEVITVLNGWKGGTTRPLLEKVWKQACGPFGTVLGPRSDRYHSDHFHLDVARYRSGPYCK
mgnify:CR=1 FL=1